MGKWAWAARRNEFFKILIDENRSFLEEGLREHQGIENAPDKWDSEIPKIVKPLEAKINFCREIIKAYSKTGLLWINPAAVVVPISPGFLIGREDSSYPKTLQFASWLPVHVDEGKQASLIKAYFTANFAKGIEETDHLTPHIRKKIEKGHDKGCFIATLNDRDVMKVVCCYKNGEASCQNITTFVGSHYKELFSLQGEDSNSCEILFLPNRTLSRLPTKTEESMYSQHMVGCYLGVSSRNCVSGGCLPEDLKALCDHFSELMYIAARDKANRELYKALKDQSQSLNKYRQMFDLLTPPLRSLTEALAQTQTDTQELRAILYEPMDAIFECQPLIEELFDDSKSISGTTIKPKHNVEDYQPKDCSDIQKVLALALSRFRGNNSTILSEEIKFYLTAENNSTHTFHQLSLSLRSVIGIKNWSDFNNKQNDFEFLKNMLRDLKMRMFTAYKPGEASKALQWALLKSFLPLDSNLKVTINPEALSEEEAYVVTQGANPLCTHGHLIQFILGVISAKTSSEKKDLSMTLNLHDYQTKPADEVLMNTETIDAAAAKKIECIFQLADPWIKPHGISDLTKMLERELTEKKEKIRRVGGYGDFHRPFANFIRRLSDDNIDMTGIIKTTTGVRIVVGNNFEVNFDDNKFKLISKRPEEGEEKK